MSDTRSTAKDCISRGIDSVNNFVLPRTQKDMKQFLGLVNYFGDHIRGASVMMSPLHEMVRDYHPKKVLEYTSATLLFLTG